MTKLNQIIAVEKGVKTQTDRDVTNLYQLLGKTPLLAGISRTYRPKDEDGDQLPAESTLVQVVADRVLEDIGLHLTRLFDVTLTKETANMSAVGDIVVDGRTLMSQVPVTWLLFLEKQLVHLSTIIKHLPALDPAERWSYDPGQGVYVTDVTQSTRTKKVPRNHVKAPATDKHQAQVEMWYEDVVVGTWDTTRFSGAMPADRRRELTQRIIKLQEAVKFAREEANSIQIVDQDGGRALLDYLLAE